MRKIDIMREVLERIAKMADWAHSSGRYSIAIERASSLASGALISAGEVETKQCAQEDHVWSESCLICGCAKKPAPHPDARSCETCAEYYSKFPDCNGDVTGVVCLNLSKWSPLNGKGKDIIE